MKPIFLALTFATLACVSPEDTCEAVRSALGYDEPGSWNATPREVMEHVEAPRTGTLTWAEGGSLGPLAPSNSETGVSVSATLDTGSAVSLDLTHVGEGRLACIDSIEMSAVLVVMTADGALQETLTVSLSSSEGTLGTPVEGNTDLSMHEFVGTLNWQPHDASGQLFLRTSWIADQPGTLRGWLIWGDSTAVQVEGAEIVGAGVGRVLAHFEAELE